MAVAKSGGQIVIAPIEVEDIVIHISGTSPLVQNCFSSKSANELLEGHMHPEIVKKKLREAKVPVRQFLGAAHIMRPSGDWNGMPKLVWWNDPDNQHKNGEPVEESDIPSIIGGVAAVGRFGFPVVAFKSAAVRAAKLLGGVMTDTRLAFKVGSTLNSDELIEIETVGGDPGPVMRMDVVRVSNGKPDIRFRPEFTRWRAQIPVRLNVAAMSLESCVSLFKGAGFSVGVGEWRAEKEGVWGAFDVVGVDRLGGKSL